MSTLQSSPAGEIAIQREGDIVAARRTVREAATLAGFSVSDITRIVTAASELARNIYRYAGSGVMRWSQIEKDGRHGLQLEFIDYGPGISDLNRAMREGYSTGGGLGLGLPGAKRLSDEMEIKTAAGIGTTVTLRKWRKS